MMTRENRIKGIMHALSGKKPMMMKKKPKIAGMGHEMTNDKKNDEGMTHSPDEGMTTLDAGDMHSADEMDAGDGMNHDEMMMEGSPEEEGMESPEEEAMETDENEHMGGEDARNEMEMKKANMGPHGKMEDMEEEKPMPHHLFGKKPGGMHILIALANAKKKGMRR